MTNLDTGTLPFLPSPSNIVAEAVVVEAGEEDKYSDVRLALDMVMLAHTDKGKERTMEEWESVVKGAGFSKYTVEHIGAIICYMGAEKMKTTALMAMDWNGENEDDNGLKFEDQSRV
ncbi:hypothetical protein ACS0TY_001586 [Phlomoides rotata]